MRDCLILLVIALIVAAGYGYHNNPTECQKLGIDVANDTKAVFLSPASTSGAPNESPVAGAGPSVPVVSPSQTPTVSTGSPSPASAAPVVTPTPHYAVGFVAQDAAPASSAAAPAAAARSAMASAAAPATANLPSFVDYDQALAAARSHHVPLLILFTGSDWCHYCKMLEQEVLSDNGFQKYLSDHYVFLTVDDLRNTPMSDDDKQKVEDLEQKFGVGGFPSLIMVDEDEHEKGRIEGYDPGSGPSAVTSRLDRIAQQPSHS